MSIIRIKSTKLFEVVKYFRNCLLPGYSRWNIQKKTFEALALQVPGGHFLIFWGIFYQVWAWHSKIWTCNLGFPGYTSPFQEWYADFFPIEECRGPRTLITTGTRSSSTPASTTCSTATPSWTGTTAGSGRRFSRQNFASSFGLKTDWDSILIRGRHVWAVELDPFRVF